MTIPFHSSSPIRILAILLFAVSCIFAISVAAANTTDPPAEVKNETAAPADSGNATLQTTPETPDVPPSPEIAPDAQQPLATLQENSDEQALLQPVPDALETAKQENEALAKKLAAAEAMLTKLSAKSPDKDGFIIGLQIEVFTLTERLNIVKSELFARDSRIETLEKQLDATAADLTTMVLRPVVSATPAAQANAEALGEGETPPPVDPQTSSTVAQGVEQLSPALKEKVQQAKKLLENGNILEAQKQFYSYCKEFPNNFYLITCLADTLFQSGQNSAAEIALNRVLELHPEDSTALSLLGVVYFRQGKLPDAEKTLRRAIELDPKKARSYNYLGVVLSQLTKSKEAETMLLKAIKLDPKYAEAYFNLAVVYATQQKPALDLARKNYQSAMRLGAISDPSLERLLR